jgi:hypothetical protein
MKPLFLGLKVITTAQKPYRLLLLPADLASAGWLWKSIRIDGNFLKRKDKWSCRHCRRPHTYRTVDMFLFFPYKKLYSPSAILAFLPRDYLIQYFPSILVCYTTFHMHESPIIFIALGCRSGALACPLLCLQRRVLSARNLIPCANPYTRGFADISHMCRSSDSLSSTSRADYIVCRDFYSTLLHLCSTTCFT